MIRRTADAPGGDIDLTDCDREPIHILGGVQGYGCLVATSSDLMIKHVSDNLGDHLGVAPDAAIGKRLLELLPQQTIHDLRTKLQMIQIDEGTGRLFGYDLMGNGRLYDVSIHATEQAFIFEFEPKRETEPRDELSLVQPLVGRVRRAEGVDGACKQAAIAMQILSGFDRVMIYRFAPDGSGEVIAERCTPGTRSFLGLHFPASDIPRQARELYKRSVLRLIADVDGKVARILPEQGASGQPLDLSMAVTRAVSPIHLQYLRNMEVAASMSVSILKDGELWGLIACHHNTPRYVDYERRTAIELFSQFFGYELSQKVEAQLQAEETQARALQDRLMIRLSGGADLVENFDVLVDELVGLVPNDGIAVISKGRIATTGSVPHEAQLHDLVTFLNTSPPGAVYATNALSQVFPPADAYRGTVSGLMAVPMTRAPRDYIVFFRREIARAVQWAGDPDKPVELGPEGKQLTPRTSFEAWSKIVRGTSAPWTDAELRVAEALRVSMIEIVLKLTDEAHDARARASEKQDLLIAELNHRVRNILNLIRGLVSQSRGDTTTVERFSEVLDLRIQSLARAHDQLTRDAWSPISLHELIEIEVRAYLGDHSERLVIDGDARLVPEAFSTVALVIHELVTNSAKYGALSDSTGRVEIGIDIGADNALSLVWRERDGPAVVAPTRRGFGSTVIEKAIPFELGGDVAMRFTPEGFEADIMIPAAHIVPAAARLPRADTRPSPGQAPDTPVAAQEGVRLSGDALVVEDMMIIATEAAEILSELGAARVHMAGTVADALRLIAAHDIRFAMLDVNLKDQTSLSIAKSLADQGVPFILATGYGETDRVLNDFPAAPVLNKPFSEQQMIATIQKSLDAD